jgi:hypothetical protein
MSIVDHVTSNCAGPKPDDLPKRLLEPIRRVLCTGDPAATIDRLFVSEHVKDLRLIIAFALVTVLAVLFVGLPGSLASAWFVRGKDWSSQQAVFSALHGFVAFYAPILGIFGAVLAWAYQAGSARLGIVDLFACEIDTLCRVALVVDSVPRAIAAFQHGSPGRNVAGNSASPTSHFTSEENYFPVFENNTGDLQSLEARVVINITASYTYLKAVRDSTRALMDMSASLNHPEPRSDKAATPCPWQDAARNVIYMMFLGLESARKAIRDLVEFEPDQTERMIVILVSELEAYRFLREQFTNEDDLRCRRLQLREAGYKKLVPKLYDLVRAGRASEPSNWELAWRLVPELMRKYDAVMTSSSQPPRLAATA